jgi:hypothetical protein
MSAEAVTKQAQWQKLFNYVLGNEATWIADIGLKAGLFRAIVDAGPTGISEDALAQKLGFAPRYVQVWCRAAYAFALLDWEEHSGYHLAPHMAELLLDPTDPQFSGGRIQFYTALYEDFRAFPEYLRTGGVWPRSAHDPWLLEALKNATKPDAASDDRYRPAPDRRDICADGARRDDARYRSRCGLCPRPLRHPFSPRPRRRVGV